MLALTLCGTYWCGASIGPTLTVCVALPVEVVVLVGACDEVRVRLLLCAVTRASMAGNSSSDLTMVATTIKIFVGDFRCIGSESREEKKGERQPSSLKGTHFRLHCTHVAFLCPLWHYQRHQCRLTASYMTAFLPFVAP